MWVKDDYVKPVLPVFAKLNVTDDVYRSAGNLEIDAEIKLRLLNELTRELFKANCVQYSKDFNPASMTYEWTAGIKTVTNNVSDVIVNDYHYEVNGLKFTHEQIEKAVMNSYPEHFL